MTFANWRTAAKGFKLYKGLIRFQTLKRFCWINNRLEEFSMFMEYEKSPESYGNIYFYTTQQLFDFSYVHLHHSFPIWPRYDLNQISSMLWKFLNCDSWNLNAAFCIDSSVMHSGLKIRKNVPFWVVKPFPLNKSNAKLKNFFNKLFNSYLKFLPVREL